MSNPLGTTFSERQKQLDERNKNVRRMYGKALEDVRQGVPGAEKDLLVARELMKEEVIIKEKKKLNQEHHNKMVEAEFGGEPNPFNTMKFSARSTMMDQILGTQDQYYQKKQKYFPSEEHAKDLLDFQKRRMNENQNRADVDPRDYKFDKGYLNFANAGAGFLGGAAPVAAESYLFSRLAGPMLGMKGVWGTGNAATKEVSNAAINSFAKNVGMDLAFDTGLGAIDQRATAAGNALSGLLANFAFRGGAHALQRTPDIENKAFRSVIDDAILAEKTYGKKFKLTDPSTYFSRGQKLHVDLPFRARTPDLEAGYNAKATSPAFRGVMSKQEADRASLLADIVKKASYPEAFVPAEKGMVQGLDDKFTNKYLAMAKKNMDALPDADVPLDPSDFKGINDAIKGTYGAAAINKDPTVKKHFQSINSAIMQNVDDAGVASHSISPEFYYSELTKLEDTLKNLDKGSSAFQALSRYKNFLVGSAEQTYPGMAKQHKLGQDQYALHGWMLDITDPVSKMINPTKASNWVADDIVNRRSGIPFDVDIGNGEKRNLTRFIGDTSAILDRKKITAATLHDNGATPHEISLPTFMQKSKVNGMNLITSAGNILGEQLGEIPVKFNLHDAGFGFSPTQINRVKTVYGTPIALELAKQNNAEQANSDEKNMASAYKELSKNQKTKVPYAK